MLYFHGTPCNRIYSGIVVEPLVISDSLQLEMRALVLSKEAGYVAIH